MCEKSRLRSTSLETCSLSGASIVEEYQAEQRRIYSLSSLLLYAANKPIEPIIEILLH
jgi:hypothetical protein